jgi:TPR repeat protein
VDNSLNSDSDTYSVGCDLKTTQVNAESGDAECQYRLGVHYANGKNHDFVQASHWFSLAATQNHSLAQFNIGVMCTLGQGVAKDEAKALQWFQRAADQGDCGAQFRLGNIHQRCSFGASTGDATESRIEAYKWFHIAAAQGYMGAQTAYETLTKSMSTSDVADGDRRAAAFAISKTV